MGYKYKVDHDYFEKIDTEYKAYILGLIYADGSIIEAKKGKRQNRLNIVLQEEDGYILEKFAHDCCGKEVDIYHPPSIKSKGWKKRATIGITSNKLCQDLINMGCSIRKSQMGMKFPVLNSDMEPHFIRGFLDGDGSIILKKLRYKYKRKTSYIISRPHQNRYKLQVAFCSTDKEFLEEIVKRISSYSYRIDSRLRKQLVHVLWLENNNETKNAVEYMYSEATYFFKRKHDKILQYNKIIKSQALGIPIEGLETT